MRRFEDMAGRAIAAAVWLATAAGWAALAGAAGLLAWYAGPADLAEWRVALGGVVAIAAAVVCVAAAVAAILSVGLVLRTVDDPRAQEMSRRDEIEAEISEAPGRQLVRASL